MISKILTILSSACNALTSLLRLRRKRQRQAISDAVHNGDSDAVAKHHHNLLRVILILLFFSLGSAGCTETLYVNQPMVPIRLEHDGIPGWWLSDSLYEATLLKLDALQNKD